ncbi:unnamed protein product [Rodentolepis nana]|uniref:Uncharacterized protein n=1 Tax=Rodentolepis nana TaxID=102285 RepID=A0A0R3T7W5_RODNA|nr:unnamed protein product [Rodentolepis nana]
MWIIAPSTSGPAKSGRRVRFWNNNAACYIMSTVNMVPLCNIGADSYLRQLESSAMLEIDYPQSDTIQHSGPGLASSTPEERFGLAARLTLCLKQLGYKRQHLTIYVCIHSDATTGDIFKAMFHVEIICSLSSLSKEIGDFRAFWEGDDGIAFHAWTLGRTNLWLAKIMQAFEMSASGGNGAKWDLSVLQFDPGPWRIYRNVYYN